MTQWGLDTLFNPAKRHMDEEKRRLQSTREQAGDSSGGKRIDLESGKVKMRRPSGDTETEAEIESEPDAAPAAESEHENRAPGQSGTVRDTASTRRGKREPTPAAIRAARRRGREPR